jgi:hypothetical protein
MEQRGRVNLLSEGAKSGVGRLERMKHRQIEWYRIPQCFRQNQPDWPLKIRWVHTHGIQWNNPTKSFLVRSSQHQWGDSFAHSVSHIGFGRVCNMKVCDLSSDFSLSFMLSVPPSILWTTIKYKTVESHKIGIISSRKTERSTVWLSSLVCHVQNVWQTSGVLISNKMQI